MQIHERIYKSIHVSNHITKFPLHSLWEIPFEKLLRLQKRDTSEQDASSFCFLLSIALTDVEVSLHVMFKTTEWEPSEDIKPDENRNVYFFSVSLSFF